MSGERTARPIVRPALAGLRPYEPGKPIEEVQRELGLDRVVKLASNEGPFGPFPAARDALDRLTPELNRYPDGGGYRLRHALAERHGVTPAHIVLGAGADGVIDGLTQALLDPGDELVSGWPSFPSYVIYTRRQGAVARTVPLQDGHYDLDALLAAIGRRTKVVAISNPNNPTGTMTSRSELAGFVDRIPDDVVIVVDQAYFEYIDDHEYGDAVEEYVKAGRNVLVLRTFSKIFGLAGLRIGYGVGPPDLVEELIKVRRPFDLTSAGQAAALASIADDAEIERRRRLNDEGRVTVERALRDAGLSVVGPAVANFVYADVGDDAQPLFDALLRLGVIVRPLAGFGAPGAIRVTVGTPDENEFFAGALARVAAEAPVA